MNISNFSVNIQNFPKEIPTDFHLESIEESKTTVSNSLWYWESAHCIYKIALYAFALYTFYRVVQTPLFKDFIRGDITFKKLFFVVAGHFIGIPPLKYAHRLINNFLLSKIEAAKAKIDFYNSCLELESNPLASYKIVIQKNICDLSEEDEETGEEDKKLRSNQLAAWIVLDNLIPSEASQLDSSEHKYTYYPVTSRTIENKTVLADSSGSRIYSDQDIFGPIISNQHVN